MSANENSEETHNDMLVNNLFNFLENMNESVKLTSLYIPYNTGKFEDLVLYELTDTKKDEETNQDKFYVKGYSFLKEDPIVQEEQELISFNGSFFTKDSLEREFFQNLREYLYDNLNENKVYVAISFDGSMKAEITHIIGDKIEVISVDEDMKILNQNSFNSKDLFRFS